MEDYLYAVVVGVAQDVLIELHCLLLVSAEEIHLDTLHADALHPGHCFLALYGVAHDTARTLGSVIRMAVGVIPQQQ